MASTLATSESFSSLLRQYVQDVRRFVWRDLTSPRAWVLAVLHASVFVLCYWLAFSLRFDFRLPPAAAGLFWSSLPMVLVLKMGTFYGLKNSRIWWRHVTFTDLVGLVKAVVLAVLILAAASQLGLLAKIPRAVLLLDGLLSLTVLGGLRGAWRLNREQFSPFLERQKPRLVFLVGTDQGTCLLAHEIQSHPDLRMRVCGFLCFHGDACRPQGDRMGGIPVLGPIDQVERLAARHRVTEVLVTAGVLPGPLMRDLMERCSAAGLALRIVAAVNERLCGGQEIPVREIEINDLLRREPVELDDGAIEQLIQGRRVLVTGAGGSIGGEICRQLLRYQPTELVLLGRGENRIFVIENELALLGTATRLVPVIGDITDSRRMRQVFEDYRPEIVFHAAAHKHVPLMEANVGEAIKNNVLGTRIVADLAHEYESKHFVLISTDKAVNPTSVMGTTKQLAERYIHALSQRSTTCFVAVRFGNVLGSAGSVVPIFQSQIRRGGPITITDPQMTRYFMTIPEASQLVLQAASMGRGGEIFVLDMGEPVRVLDMARDMIRLSGLPPEAIEITYIGLRPGEKLYEELQADGETMQPTEHPGVLRATNGLTGPEQVFRAVEELAAWNGSLETITRQQFCEKLRSWVPSYQPSLAGPAGTRPPTSGTTTSTGTPILGGLPQGIALRSSFEG